MKKVVLLLAFGAVLVLFTGCDVWFFVQGGGGESGIEVYADISPVVTDVSTTLRAELYQKSGNFVFIEEKVGATGEEILQTKFSDKDSGTYKVVVWYDSDGEGDPDWSSEIGFTSNEFYYRAGDYQFFAIDEAGDWDVSNLQKP
jgi:hypothetical protein